MSPTDREKRVNHAAALLGVSFDLANAFAYTYNESQGRYSQHAREQAARHILWKGGDTRGWEPGSFSQSLLTAWDRADQDNRARLSVAFPVIADAYDVRNQDGIEGLVKWAGIEANA